VSLLVDTSVWSLAFRRDDAGRSPHVAFLREALAGADLVVTTGVIVQELLQGLRGPRDRQRLLDALAVLPCPLPDRDDHVEAAEIRNVCRRAGVQVGTIDALLIQLCRRHDLDLLSADRDFEHAARHVPFRLWQPG
jgi:predicted nucleic acid-binding protein